jgi:hypothetical protein
LLAFGIAAPAQAAEKQVVIFEPKVEGANLGELEKQALDKALAEAIKELGYSPIPKLDLDAVLQGERAGKCESAECQVRIARLLDAGYVLRYKLVLSSDVVEQAAKATVPRPKKKKRKSPRRSKARARARKPRKPAKKPRKPKPTPVQAAPVPTGPTANWRFQASLFNVTLAATAESALNQPSECPQCSSSQAAQNIAELAKKLLIADKSHPRGSIEISTTPGDATVFVDNVELLGKTPRARRCRSRPSPASTSCGSKRPTTSLHEQEVTVSDS